MVKICPIMSMPDEYSTYVMCQEQLCMMYNSDTHNCGFMKGFYHD